MFDLADFYTDTLPKRRFGIEPAAFHLHLKNVPNRTFIKKGKKNTIDTIDTNINEQHLHWLAMC